MVVYLQDGYYLKRLYNFVECTSHEVRNNLEAVIYGMAGAVDRMGPEKWHYIKLINLTITMVLSQLREEFGKDISMQLRYLFRYGAWLKAPYRNFSTFLGIHWLLYRNAFRS